MSLIRSAGGGCLVTCVVGALVTLTGCAGSDEPSLGEFVTPTTPAPGTTSLATVTVGELLFTIPVVCYDAGAGEVVAVGTGLTTEGEPLEVRIESSIVDPYVGVRVGGEAGVTYEPALGEPLDLFNVETGISGGAIFFVGALDVNTGVGVDAGVGSVEVTCLDYEREAPPAS